MNPEFMRSDLGVSKVPVARERAIRSNLLSLDLKHILVDGSGNLPGPKKKTTKVGFLCVASRVDCYPDVAGGV